MAGNLELIKSVEVTTSLSEIDITDCFNADYDIYKIITSGFTTVSTTATDLDGRLLDSSGTVIDSLNYDYVHLNLKANATFTSSRLAGTNSMKRLFGNSDASPEGGGTVSYIYRPYSSSTFTFAIYDVSSSQGGNHTGRKGISVLKSAERCTGIRIVTTTANVDEGKVSVYGLASN